MTLRQAALFEVLLMILLGAPEFGGRRNLRDNRPWETSLRGISRCPRFGFLLRRVIENRRTVLRADVRALAIQSRRVVVVPEHFENIVVADHLRIEGHF